MDLFLVSNASTRSQYNVLLLVGLGLVSIVAIYKLFNSFDQNDSDDEQDGKNEKAGRPAGIFNQGNTCFVNSLLQALSSLDSFQYLLQFISNRFRGSISSNEQLIIQLRDVLKQINNSNDSISIGRLLDTISQINEDLINLQQQDAHQLYIAIISCVQTVLNKQKKMDLSASIKIDNQNEEQEVENPLIGYIKSSTICMTCRSETSIKIDPFYDLSLDISKMYVNNIHTALAQFQRQERIDCWICSNCSIKNHCFRLRKNKSLLKGRNAQQLLFICEDILQFLQGQDFQEHQIKDLNEKLSDFVKMYRQDFLKMGDDPQKELIFMQIEGKQSSILKRSLIIKYPKILVLHMKQLVLNPITGQPFLLKKHIYFSETLGIQTKYKNKQYRLTSLLTHIGNQLYGHYLSFRRPNRDSNQWFVVSDSASQRANWEMVQQSRAYMLFYQTD